MSARAGDEAALPVATADVGLDRDRFMRELIRTLAGTLEDVVGLHEAEAYISVVGARMGEAIGKDYHRALAVDAPFTPGQMAAVFVDLKRRIEGDFRVLSADSTKIVLANRACPFGDKVIGRPSMCMMTSNVFGRIGADNAGYARVAIERAIAQGDRECRVVVHLVPPSGDDDREGREYFRVD